MKIHLQDIIKIHPRKLDCIWENETRWLFIYLHLSSNVLNQYENNIA